MTPTLTPDEVAVATAKLRTRADEVARDADIMRADGLADAAGPFDIIAAELRHAATLLERAAS